MGAETKPETPARPSGGRRQTLVGVVTSAKMEKTIVVRVTRTVQHGLYRRVMRVAKKYYAHDEHRQARPGDKVKIAATRPLSKLKRWRLMEVLGRAGEAPGSGQP